MDIAASKRMSRALAALGVAVTLVPLSVVTARQVATTVGSPAPSNDAVATAKAQENYGRLPVSFVANAGQHDPAVRFSAQAGKSTLFVTPTEAVLSLPGAEGSEATALRLGLVGANPAPEVVGEKPLSGKVNYLTGNDPKEWKTDLPTYAKVTSKAVYPGIDLTWYGKGQQHEYDFVVAPGADPDRIAMSVTGANDLRLDDGELVMSTPAGEVRQHAPVVYQDVNGKRRSVEGRFMLRDRTTVGFTLGEYDHRLPLVIDPVLAYSSYLGGMTQEDGARGVAVDATGAAYVTGDTTSSDFPIASPPDTTPFQGRGTGNRDAFVTKLDPTGSVLVYSTYLGGSGRDEGLGIAVDAKGIASVAGLAASSDFPTTPGAFDTTLGSNVGDVFVTKLNPSGSALAYSTYLGGSGIESSANVVAIALGPAGRIYVSGGTALSADFPTTQGAFDRTPSGASDVYLAVLDPSLAGDGTGVVSPLNPALVYSTLLGGNENETGPRRQGAVAVDPAGIAYVAGRTASADFPTTPGAFDTTVGLEQASVGSGVEGEPRIGGDAFVAVIDPSRPGNGTGLVGPDNPAMRYSTFLGGSLPASGHSEWGEAATAIAVRGGVVYVGGNVANSDFPVTPGAFQTQTGGCATPGCDGFVVQLDTRRSGDGSGLISTSNPAVLYSTLFGTEGAGENLTALAVDAAGQVLVGGWTYSTTLPMRKALDTTCSCFYDAFLSDAFVARLRLGASDGDLSRPRDGDDLINDPTDLLFSTYLGGSGYEFLYALAADERANVYVVGRTNSPYGPVVNEDFPTTPKAAQTDGGPPCGPESCADGFVSRISFGTPSLSVVGASVAEGKLATTDLDFTVSLSGYSSSTVTVNYATVDGTAVAPKDYTARTGTLTFAPGEQTKTVTVKVNGDTKVEPNEKLALKLSAPIGAPLTVAKAVGRILNDD